MSLTQEEKNAFAKDIASSAELTELKPQDNINPHHYASMKIPPNVYITENKLEWEVGNIVKYISRYKSKNGKEDLLKAMKYLELLIERKYENE